MGSNIAGWCVPTTSSSSDAAGINRVIFSNIDNTDNTNTNNSGVEDFTGSVSAANIQTGSSYDLSVYGNTNGSYEYHILAWIDWNRDGDFSDANEEYDLGTNYNTSNALTSSSPLSITVPVGALTGSNFIRIAYGYSSNPTSCATSFGEFETYALNITSPLTWTGSSSTVWSNAANWSSGSVPGSSDDVIIADVTNNPVLDATDQVGSITIQNGGVLTLSSSVILTASYVELQSGGDLVISNGELNCTGKFDHDGDLTMSGSGILDIDGEYESSASATEIITGGTIEVAGEWDGALDNAFTPDDGTIIMNGSSDKNLAQHANSNFHNLTIANSGGDVDVTAALDIDGDLTINASADLDIGGGNANIELAGSFTNNGTFTTSGETITFDGAAGDKTSSAISDATLDIVVDKTSAGKVTFAGTCSFDEVTITNGILAITSNTMTADNTISINNGAELEIGTGTFNADGTINANTTGEIDFTDAGKLICSSSITSLGDLDHEAGTVEIDGATTSIPTETFYNLSIKTAGTKQATGTITVENDLTTGSTSNCKLDMQANNLTLKGNLNVGATDGLDLSDASCTFTIGGSSTQSITHAGVSSSGSAIIYSEDFTGQNGKGAWGGGSDHTGVDWTTDVSSASLSDSYDYMKVVSERIEVRDVDGECIWYSPSVDISNYSNVSVSIELSESGNLESDDYVDAEYQIGSDGWIDITNGQHSDDFSSATASISNLNGSTLQIRIKMDVDRGNEYIRADDIVFSGTPNFKHFNKLTLNNSSGFTMSSDLKVSGVLTLTSGNITTGSNTLTIASGGSISRAGGKGCECVVGNLAKSIAVRLQ